MILYLLHSVQLTLVFYALLHYGASVSNELALQICSLAFSLDLCLYFIGWLLRWWGKI